MLGCLRPNNQQGGNTSPLINRQASLRLREPEATSTHAPLHGPTHQRAKTQLHQKVGRHWSLPVGSLHKSLDLPHQPGGRNQKQENYNPAACKARSTNAGQTLPWEQLLPCPCMMRGKCTAGIHRTSLTEGHISKFEKHK